MGYRCSTVGSLESNNKFPEPPSLAFDVAIIVPTRYKGEYSFNEMEVLENKAGSRSYNS
jgi:hypothetical protein